LTLVLDNMRSAENTGTIFRLAECAGLTEIITCGITPSPPHPALLKTAMGTDQRVRTRHIPSTLDAVAQLQAEGMRVCAAETAGGSASLFKLGAENPAKMGGSQLLSPPLAIILGTGGGGVVHLPTFGQKNSLNVATCASVLVYEILRQWGKLDE
ncbi:Alpha/beta knot methyltransferase, partial [Pavlovales sp. CCMP2436]